MSRFNHTIPKFICQNFLDVAGKVHIYNKLNGKNYSKQGISKSNRTTAFGSMDFYGKEGIIELLIGKECENKTIPVLKKLCKTNDYEALTNSKNFNLLLDYLYFQHVRTEKFKKDSIDFKDSEEYNEIVKDLNKNIKDKVDEKYFSENSHKGLIFDENNKKHFMDIINAQSKNIYLLLNKTGEPFILPDTGMAWDENQENGLHCYLPLSPNQCLFYSEKNYNNYLIEINVKWVNKINIQFFKGALGEIIASKKESFNLFENEKIED